MKSIQEMVSEILDSGYTEGELAKLVNTTQPSINRLKKGITPDPGYAVGRAIESVHESISLGHSVAQHG